MRLMHVMHCIQCQTLGKSNIKVVRLLAKPPQWQSLWRKSGCCCLQAHLSLSNNHWAVTADTATCTQHRGLHQRLQAPCWGALCTPYAYEGYMCSTTASRVWLAIA